MLIKTKFNPGDKAYVMYNNELSFVQIREVRTASAGNTPKIDYLVTKWAKNYQSNLPDWFNENRLFKSKTAIIKNLLNNA